MLQINNLWKVIIMAKRIIFAILLIVSNLSLAVEIPKDFLYKDNLIDPNCILEIYSNRFANLKECSLHLDKKITEYFLKDDLIGYEYINKNNNSPGMLSYKYMGKLKDAHVIHAFMIGVSISRLDYIKYLKIENNNLKLIKSGPSGDRSFGGISDARLENNSIIYDLSITAKLFITNFAKGQEDNIKLDNLSDCAVCYFGKIHHVNDKIEYITLSDVISYKDNSIQKCFNEMHSEFIKKQHLKLSKKEANIFAENFISKCLQ